jgi:hypothetical protein
MVWLRKFIVEVGPSVYLEISLQQALLIVR